MRRGKLIFLSRKFFMRDLTTESYFINAVAKLGEARPEKPIVGMYVFSLVRILQSKNFRIKLLLINTLRLGNLYTLMYLCIKTKNVVFVEPNLSFPSQP